MSEADCRHDGSRDVSHSEGAAMKWQILRGKVLKRAILATAALLAIRLFFVQQLIAAFLIFSVLFACLALMALILFALDLAWRTALARTEAYVMVLGQPERRGRTLANDSAATNMLTPVPAHRIAPHKQETKGVRVQLTQEMPFLRVACPTATLPSDWRDI
jgi:hypothetical protein